MSGGLISVVQFFRVPIDSDWFIHESSFLLVLFCSIWFVFYKKFFWIRCVDQVRLKS